jgi:hypothetical protein
MAVCRARVDRWENWLQHMLAELQADCVDIDPLAHDRAMALVQGLVHAGHMAQAAVLRELAPAAGGLPGLHALRTIGHDLDLTVTGRILSGNPAIYEDIQFGNPHVLPMLGCLADAVALLRAQVVDGSDDARALVRERFLQQPAAWFGSDELATRSHGFERMGYLQADLQGPRYLSVYLPQDRPGSLRGLLDVFERLGVNLASIHSSRTPDGELHFRIGLDALPVPLATLRDGGRIGRHRPRGRCARRFGELTTRPGRRAPGTADRRTDPLRPVAFGSTFSATAAARRSLRLRQQRRGDQQVAPVLLHHAQLAGIERLQLVGGDVDALDLAAVFEVADECSASAAFSALAGDEFGQLRLRLAALARLFLLEPLGLDALVLLALRADRVGLGQVDVFARARLAAQACLRRGLPLAGRACAAAGAASACTGLPPRRCSPCVGLPAAGLCSWALRSGLGAGLKPRPSNWSRSEMVIVRRRLSSAVVAVRWRRRRSPGPAAIALRMCRSSSSARCSSSALRDSPSRAAASASLRSCSACSWKARAAFPGRPGAARWHRCSSRRHHAGRAQRAPAPDAVIREAGGLDLGRLVEVAAVEHHRGRPARP